MNGLKSRHSTVLAGGDQILPEPVLCCEFVPAQAGFATEFRWKTRMKNWMRWTQGIVLLAVIGLGGCGQKGDLYLPDEPARDPQETAAQEK